MKLQLQYYMTQERPFSTTETCDTHTTTYCIKGAQVWDFDVLDSNNFFIMKYL